MSRKKMNDKEFDKLIYDSVVSAASKDAYMPDMNEKIKAIANSAPIQSSNTNLRKEKMEEIKKQKAPRVKWVRLAAAAMACVLVCGAIVGGYFLFRGDNLTAEESFSNAISKMSQEAYVNIDDEANQETYIFESGKMVSIYSKDENAVQWLNSECSIRDEGGVYYKNKDADKSKLSKTIINV
ncbi:MAG: hypothetical protein FWG51_01140, partial [Firmicutes bacterium]|nr:hypothetical protein [Bacillota bacterium]